jgi:hypothetical protein
VPSRRPAARPALRAPGRRSAPGSSASPAGSAANRNSASGTCRLPPALAPTASGGRRAAR